MSLTSNSGWGQEPLNFVGLSTFDRDGMKGAAEEG